MKFLLASAFLMFGSYVWAVPSVGDYSSFDVNWVKSSNSTHGKLELELTTYDQAQDQFSEKQTLLDDAGKVTSTVKTMNRSDLVSDALITSILAQCAADGGTLEALSIPAGNFASCKLPVDSTSSTGSVWVASAPFGIVKQDTVSKTDGSELIITLQSFRLGK